MSLTLTLSAGTLRRLAGIDDADTTKDAAIALVTADEQAAIEYALDPVVLAASASDAGLLATLVLGVSEVIAGSYLQGLLRPAGQLVSLGYVGTQVSGAIARDAQSLADALGQKGSARLAPYQRTTLPLPGVIWGDMGLAKAASVAGSPLTVTGGGEGAAVGDGVTSGALVSTLSPSSAFDAPWSDDEGDGLGEC